MHNNLKFCRHQIYFERLLTRSTRLTHSYVNGLRLPHIGSTILCLIWLMETNYSLIFQEARRAAEKAYDVSKVDERVNKAVVAANRSANAARVAAVKAVQKQRPNKSNGVDLAKIYHLSN